MKYSVSDTPTRIKVESSAIENLVARINDVPQHGKQQFTDTTNHLAVDKSAIRCAGQRQL